MRPLSSSLIPCLSNPFPSLFSPSSTNHRGGPSHVYAYMPRPARDVSLNYWTTRGSSADLETGLCHRHRLSSISRRLNFAEQRQSLAQKLGIWTPSELRAEQPNLLALKLGTLVRCQKFILLICTVIPSGNSVECSNKMCTGWF